MRINPCCRAALAVARQDDLAAITQIAVDDAEKKSLLRLPRWALFTKANLRRHNLREGSTMYRACEIVEANCLMSHAPHLMFSLARNSRLVTVRTTAEEVFTPVLPGSLWNAVDPTDDVLTLLAEIVEYGPAIPGYPQKIVDYCQVALAVAHRENTLEDRIVQSVQLQRMAIEAAGKGANHATDVYRDMAKNIVDEHSDLLPLWAMHSLVASKYRQDDTTFSEAVIWRELMDECAERLDPLPVFTGFDWPEPSVETFVHSTTKVKPWFFVPNGQPGRGHPVWGHISCTPQVIDHLDEIIEDGPNYPWFSKQVADFCRAIRPTGDSLKAGPVKDEYRYTKVPALVKKDRPIRPPAGMLFKYPGEDEERKRLAADAARIAEQTSTPGEPHGSTEQDMMRKPS